MLGYHVEYNEYRTWDIYHKEQDLENLLGEFPPFQYILHFKWLRIFNLFVKLFQKLFNL